jgi:NAD(P)-dependent dehydrogenase (short-subunit alcohol dehydrogenase family)
VKAGVSKEKGWPHQYSVTKAAITAAKITMARDNPELLVNCCCPGRYVLVPLSHVAILELNRMY